MCLARAAGLFTALSRDPPTHARSSKNLLAKMKTYQARINETIRGHERSSPRGSRKPPPPAPRLSSLPSGGTRPAVLARGGAQSEGDLLHVPNRRLRGGGDEDAGQVRCSGGRTPSSPRHRQPMLEGSPPTHQGGTKSEARHNHNRHHRLVAEEVADATIEGRQKRQRCLQPIVPCSHCSCSASRHIARHAVRPRRSTPAAQAWRSRATIESAAAAQQRRGDRAV